MRGSFSVYFFISLILGCKKKKKCELTGYYSYLLSVKEAIKSALQSSYGLITEETNQVIDIMGESMKALASFKKKIFGVAN